MTGWRAGSPKPPDTVAYRTRIEWSLDGREVAKSVSDRHRLWRQQFAYELRVNRLLSSHPPPVPTPRMTAWHRGRRQMVFEAVRGAPMGPKFPLALSGADLGRLLGVASLTPAYAERRRWLRRLPLVSRLAAAEREGVLSPLEAKGLARRFREDPPRWVFSHGDVTPRNVLVDHEAGGRAVLIDWEWAGLYPAGYELAFVWFVVLDVAGARSTVAGAVPAEDNAWFWRSALLIQLLHLPWLRNRPATAHFVANHERTRHELVQRVLEAAP